MVSPGKGVGRRRRAESLPQRKREFPRPPDETSAREVGPFVRIREINALVPPPRYPLVRYGCAGAEERVAAGDRALGTTLGPLAGRRALRRNAALGCRRGSRGARRKARVRSEGDTVVGRAVRTDSGGGPAP
jgi:hypothetical protein